MTLQLDPCSFCGCAVVKMTAWEKQTFCAAQCRACGARGPVRAVLAEHDLAAVQALAADDWNRSPNASPGATAATAEPIPIPAPRERGAQPEPSGGGAGTPKRDRTKAAANKINRSWNSPRKRHPIADRIEAYLKRAGKTAWSGTFSVSDQSIDNYLKGKSMPSAGTADKLALELDRLEAEDAAGFADEDPAGEIGPRITTLPNSLPPIAKPGSLPDLKSVRVSNFSIYDGCVVLAYSDERPARCAEVR